MTPAVRGSGLGVCLAFGVLTAEAAARPTGQQETRPPAPRDASAHQPALQPFLDRLQVYTAMRDRLEQSLPPIGETSDPVELTARERALAAGLAHAHAGVEEGHIFAAESQPALREIVRADFSHRSRADVRALDDDMPRRARVRVNAEYPEGVPLVTVPAGLLRALPALPEDVEYRIVGRDLLLLDTRADFVIDVLRGAVPR